MDRSQAISEGSLRILGVDPGLNVTGYGVIEIDEDRISILEAGVVRGTAKASLTTRVREIHAGMADVISALKPHVMAVEELYSHYERPRTAILMGHARGVICLAAAMAGVAVKHYAATRIKKMLTGNGRAPKVQVQSAIQREFCLPELPTPPDVADALAVAVCHFYLSGNLNNVRFTPTAPSVRPVISRQAPRTTP